MISNYRPISLLPALSKVMEKVIHDRVINFCNANNIISLNQFGCIPGSSSADALLKYMGEILNCKENKLNNLSRFLDLSKAFDTTDHNILQNKLSHNGIRGKALEWLKIYLNNRYQYVFFKDHNSIKLPVRCGVPLLFYILMTLIVTL